MDKTSGDSIFSLVFLGGYTARQMIFLVNNLLGEIPMTFYRDRFEIKHAKILDEKTGRKIVVDFTPYMKYILNYTTNDEFYDKHEKIVMTPSIINFTNYIKSTSKKDVLEMNCYSNKLDTLFVNILKVNSGGGINCFKNINFKQFDIVNRDKSKEEIPNIKISLNELCTLCSNISKAKSQYKHVEFVGYRKGLSFHGVGNTDVASLGDKWGVCDEKELIGVYKLEMDHNKSLSCIQNITESGVVALFFEENIIKMKFPTGCYGDITIIFDNGKKDNTPEQTDESESETSSEEGSDGGYWSS